MKIKKSITKNVKDALDECKRTLTWAILELCKEIGGENNNEVNLQSPIVLAIAKAGNRKGSMLIESNFVNRIFYGPMDRMGGRFILCYDDDGIASSYDLSIMDLQIIYNELKKTVLHKQ